MGSKALVEVIRFIIVVTFTGLSYRFARTTGAVFPGLDATPETHVFVITVIGTAAGYVAGGVFARTLDTVLQSAESRLAQRHASELMATILGLLLGLALGTLLVWPLLIVIPQAEIAYPVAALILVVLATFGMRFASRKRVELFGILGVVPAGGGEAPGGGSLLDASAAIDGRILPLWKAGMLPAPVCVPAFIIWELQGIADSSDPMRRRRGQRGLEVLSSLREAGAPVRVLDEDPAGTTEPDAKLLIVAKRHGMPVVTSDSNLAKVAELQGLQVLSLHALADLLRPPVHVGEKISVQVVKEGRERAQGVGYLDDGTMVVVERGRDDVGKTLEVEVTSVLQNAGGRMLFAKPWSEHVDQQPDNVDPDGAPDPADARDEPGPPGLRRVT